MKYTKQIIKTDRYTVTIHKPILTGGEKQKREQELLNALTRFGKAIEKEKSYG